MVQVCMRYVVYGTGMYEVVYCACMHYQYHHKSKQDRLDGEVLKPLIVTLKLHHTVHNFQATQKVLE